MREVGNWTGTAGKVTLGALEGDTAAPSPPSTDHAGSVVAGAGSEDVGQLKTG